MNVRRAEIKDVDEILDMALEFEHYLLEIDDSLVQEAPPREVFHKFLVEGFDDKKHRLYVVEGDGETLVGFGDFWAYPEFLHGGIAGYLNNLYVREGHRGEGVGHALIERMLADARDAGVVAMHVPVKSKNVKAIEFYRKVGIDEQLAMMETRLD